MTPPTLAGVHHIKIPVTDLRRSMDWYARVFGFRTTLVFPEADGEIRGASGEIPGLAPAGIAFRENPEAARGCENFDPVSFGVADRPAMEAWVEHLDALGVAHSPIIEASLGWLLIFDDPDGLQLHLYTWAEHGIDQTDRPGYGRPPTADES